MRDTNLTPDQRNIPRAIRRQAFDLVPETCDVVRRILGAAQDEIAAAYAIPPEDIVALDAALSRAFCRIRDEVTQPFRTALMRALQHSISANTEGATDDTACSV